MSASLVGSEMCIRDSSMLQETRTCGVIEGPASLKLAYISNGVLCSVEASRTMATCQRVHARAPVEVQVLLQ
eukprot:14891675-Alexandrium_andersonii.AAC.1